MAALLGGQASRLDLIAQAQSAPATGAIQPAFISALEPAAGPSFGIVTRSSSCETGFVTPSVSAPLAAPAAAPGLRKALSPEDFLGSRRVAIGNTHFDGAWDRVRLAALPRGAARDLLATAQAMPSQTMLGAVNGWANARIRYVEDRDQYGKADYWASASETLRRRAGDCEDIAIAKMQVLAAMGVPREAMFLTIARDLARASDHAMLVVRIDGRHWLLDNATDQVLDAGESYDYRPIMSFSAENKWLHGY
jgi:predicted transglutaminase-like cysteine proteinase